MLLRPEQLTGHLAQPLAPLYLLHGNSPLRVIEAADALRSAARAQGFDEREVMMVTPQFAWHELDQAAGNLSLFGSNKLIDLRIPGGKPGKDGAEALLRHAARPLAGVVTLITLPELDWKTRKLAWFTRLSEAAVTLELNDPPREALPDWIRERLARQGQHAAPEVLAFIAEHVEGNLLAAHQEIQKLGLICPPGQLDTDSVHQAVLNVARYSLADLRPALLEGDFSRLARLLDGLRAEGAPPPLVLWWLTNELRSLAAIRRALDEGQPIAAALKNERIFDKARARLIEKRLPHWPSAALHAALAHAAHIDRIVKGVARGELWDECLLLCRNLAVRPARAR